MSHIYSSSKPTPNLFLLILALQSLLLILALLFAPSVHAQEPPSSITQRDGLPSNGITALALHHESETLWIGTIAGLGKWQALDGRAMTVELPLDEHHILALHDEGEVLWVGTADGIAHRSAEGWQTWQRGEDGLRSDWATSFVSHQGLLLVGTYGGGVQAWTGTAWQDVGLDLPSAVGHLPSEVGHLPSEVGHLPSEVGHLPSEVGNAPLQVTALASEGESLWAGTPRGLWRWDGGRWQEENLPVESLQVKALVVADDQLWLASDRGLFYRQVDSVTKWQATPFSDTISAIAHHSEGFVAATLNKVVRFGEIAANPLQLNSYVSSLLFTDKQLIIGTMRQGVIFCETGKGGGGDGAHPQSMIKRQDGNNCLPLTPSPPLPIASSPPPPIAGSSHPPIVLLRGLGDSNEVQGSNLRFLARWLRRDGYRVGMASYDDQVPLLEKVAAVRETVAEIKAETGQDEVILMAHSFGGLVAKAYLASGASDVAGLVTLGTPHAGVRMAYNSLVMDLPTDERASIRELLPEHVALIAPFMAQGQVPQLHIGGNLLPRDNLLAGFPLNDGIITAASATVAAGSTRVVKALHGWTLATLQFGIPSLLWPDNLYINSIHPWIQRLPDVPLQRAPESTADTEIGFTQRALFAQTLAAGETVTASLFLTEQPATWLLDAPGVAMNLMAPDGKRYESERFLLGDTIAHLPYRENILQALDLWSTRRRPGLWQAELSNQSDMPVRADLALIEPAASLLSISLLEPWVKEGDRVTIELLGEPKQVYLASLAQQEVSLIEEASGRYRATLEAPSTSGYYPLRVSTGEIERWAVVGVYNSRWRVTEANVTQDENAVILHLTLQGSNAGEVALGLRLLDEGDSVAAQLVGPFGLSSKETHTLTQRLPIPPTAQRGKLSLEWQLFDAGGALVPTGEQGWGEIKD